MRPIWKGSISFGLVNIPIALYPATQREELRFHFLRKGDLSRVNNKRVAEVDGKEVAWDDIVRGYEYEKGKFVVLGEDDFARVDVEATQTVDIQEFVPLKDINPILFAKPYYMEAGKGGEKAYALLREAMRKGERVGVAKVVIRTREHLATVKVQGKVLILELMHFATEIVDPAFLEKDRTEKIGPRELTMATQLVDSMSNAWDPEKYHDDYREALLKVIDEKVAAGGKEISSAPKKAPKPTNVIDLVSVLKRSLAEHGTATRKAPAKKSRRKAA
ncbi:MAG: Ku protein [Verrucomicrobia bacterium]|nr:Ku protein [Verrucomicrobiota bacterium]